MIRVALRVLGVFLGLAVAQVVLATTGYIQYDYDDSVTLFSNCAFPSEEVRDQAFGYVCCDDVALQQSVADWQIHLADPDFCDDIWNGSGDGTDLACCFLREHHGLPQPTPDPCDGQVIGDGVYTLSGLPFARTQNPITGEVTNVVWEVVDWDELNLDADLELAFCDTQNAATVPPPSSTDCITSCAEYTVSVLSNIAARDPALGWGALAASCPVGTCDPTCTNTWSWKTGWLDATGTVQDDRCIFDASGCVVSINTAAFGGTPCEPTPGCDAGVYFWSSPAPGECRSCEGYQ